MDDTIKSYLLDIENALSYFLPSTPTKQWTNMVFGSLPIGCLKEDVASRSLQMLDIARSLVQCGGKRWRPLLCLLFFKAFDKSASNKASNGNMQLDIAKLCCTVELVHTASLLHDDIEDKAQTRRGSPCAYLTYGVDVVINAASWLYFVADVCIQQATNNKALKLKLLSLCHAQLRRLHLGQAMDISWHNSDYTPTIQEYKAMCACKTGTLCEFAVLLGLVAAKASKKIIQKATNIAKDLSLGFQVLDDVINLEKGNPGKKRGDDIVEGKKSFPVLLFLQNATQEQKKALQECFLQAKAQGTETKAVQKAIDMICSAGAISKAKDYAHTLIKKAAHNLTLLSPLSQQAQQEGGRVSQGMPQTNTFLQLAKDLFLQMLG